MIAAANLLNRRLRALVRLMYRKLGPPFEMVHKCLRIFGKVDEKSASFTLLDRDVLVETPLHLETVLEPLAVALPAVVVLHES